MDIIFTKKNCQPSSIQNLWSPLICIDATNTRNAGIAKKNNNNRVERLHNTVREREKVMRGLKVDETPIIEGHRLFYNYIKPHEGLNGLTPSEKAGITVEGDNKWLTLMHKAVQYQKSKESC